jgi:hypothetical protein
MPMPMPVLQLEPNQVAELVRQMSPDLYLPRTLA